MAPALAAARSRRSRRDHRRPRAGLDTTRQVAWSDSFDVAVFNPSAHARSDVVRFDLSPARWLARMDGPPHALRTVVLRA